MKELQQAIDVLSKQNEKERTILHSLQQTLHEQQYKTHTTVKRFLHKGYPPNEVAELFDLSIEEVEAIRTQEADVRFPEDYLTDGESEQFYMVLKAIRLMDDYQLVGDHLIFPFINKVNERYQKELREFVETDDEFSFDKFALASQRNDIREYLINRLTREVENHKRYILLNSKK